MIESKSIECSLSKVETKTYTNTDILEMIATGVAASKVYDSIALMYEAKHAGLRCSLLELKGNVLIHGGAPSLPKGYCDAVNGLVNGPSVGSCGTSTYTGKRVLVENIETDPKWSKIKDVALPHGMRCCWSEPIKSSRGKTLGAFGMYYNHPCLPNAEEILDLESGSRLAGIIMEREQRELALRQSENKYRTLVENLPQRFFLKDKNSIFISCSINMANDLDTTPTEIIGTTDYDHFPAKNAKQYQEDDRRIMQTGITEEAEEKIIINNKERLIHIVKVPALDENSNVNGILGIYWDITEQNLLKEQLYQSQKMESIGTLVGGVAHEFNNTLAGITGRVYLAKTHAKDNPKLIRHIDIISTLSFQAADMIQQLMTFSRKNPVKMDPVDLNVLSKDILKLQKYSVPANIRVDVHHCPHTLPIIGNTVQVQQILLNLLHNARDAVALVENPLITLTFDRFDADKLFLQQHAEQQAQHFAHMTVKDNGHGISIENMNSIFDPFYTTKEVGKGTGLGLAMVYGAIQTHGGVITVESELDKGTEMHVYIPLTPSVAHNEHQEDRRIIYGNGETILLVDDDFGLREIGKEILQSLGYKALITSNGHEAIETYTANKDSISLTIMDVVMPEMGGIEASLALKAINENVKIVFSTGYDKEHVITEELLKDNIIITKPYDVEKLSLVISDALES